MKTLLVVSGLLFSAFASTSYGGELNAQGMPRHTIEACQKAVGALGTKISQHGFLVTRTDCVGITEDVGEFVPVVNAVGTQAQEERTDQWIGARHASYNLCRAELEKKLHDVIESNVLEAECTEGKQYNELTGTTETFHQAWITSFAEAPKHGSLDLHKLEQEQRRLKNYSQPSSGQPISSGSSTAVMVNNP